MADGYYRIRGISAIDVNNISVEKYGSRDKPPNGRTSENREEKRRYHEVQAEKEMNIKVNQKQKIKEFSLQEHMEIMSWNGRKMNSLLKQ
ncbi:MAG: hypothetical protein IKW28_03715 [Lachnospiraceae bacterium]|nr:hypothetical protein [Lachnospiraceae bacterium]